MKGLFIESMNRKHAASDRLPSGVLFSNATQVPPPLHVRHFWAQSATVPLAVSSQEQGHFGYELSQYPGVCGVKPAGQARSPACTAGGWWALMLRLVVALRNSG